MLLQYNASHHPVCGTRVPHEGCIAYRRLSIRARRAEGEHTGYAQYSRLLLLGSENERSSLHTDITKSLIFVLHCLCASMLVTGAEDELRKEDSGGPTRPTSEWMSDKI